MSLLVPRFVKLNTLANMKIYLCGGAVRDQEMGIEPKDRDYVVVGATPADMLALGFEQVGADFPVFLHPETREEYALARTERKNGVGYHGFDVTFDKTITLSDDLERRDLTINSMARDLQNDILFDPFGGLEDLKNKVLRHTSSAFKDDPLRVIRLARFAARMPSFSIHDTTFMFARKMVDDGELNHLPHERLAAEIVKVLETCTTAGVQRFFDLLGALGCENNVHFFSSVKMWRLAAAGAAVADLTGDARLQAFTALAGGDRTFSMHVGGSEGAQLCQLLEQNRLASSEWRSPQVLLDLLTRIGWQNSSRLDAFVKIVTAAQYRLNMIVAYDAVYLKAGYDVMQPVSSDLGVRLAAAGVSGKKIGAEIREQRLRLANTLLNGPINS